MSSQAPGKATKAMRTTTKKPAKAVAKKPSKAVAKKPAKAVASKPDKTVAGKSIGQGQRVVRVGSPGQAKGGLTKAKTKITTTKKTIKKS